MSLFVYRFKNLWVCFLLLALFSCSEKAEETILTADDLFAVREIAFEGIAGEQKHTIEFEAPHAWTSEIHSLGMWLQADVFKGNAGRASITVRPKSDNFGVTAREATLEIYIDGMEAYTIKVNQASAATGDIQVNGHVDEGVMNLRADDSGNEFSDTLWVTSSKRWTLKADASAADVLSFETDGESRNGEEQTVQVVVKASYNKFSSSVYEGKFYIQTEEGTAVPITVKAAAKVGVYDSQHALQGEAERTSFQLVDTLKTGRFETDFYIDSNVRWTLGDTPEWIETATDKNTITNVTSSGKITQSRHHISFQLKKNALSRDGKTGIIELVDVRGEVVKKINVTYAGVGSSYVSNNLAFKGQDPFGNPWGFEAKASSIDRNNDADYWKEVSHEFEVTTSSNFTSISDAPFHLILVRGDGGVPRKQEVHWAKLEMVAGSPSMTGDLYTRKIAIRVNDRGDSDDKNKLTNQTEWRYAFVYIVPLDVSFNDLWNGDKLKDKYANDMLIMAQKNDPDAQYTFGFKEVNDGGTVDVPAKGGAVTLSVTPGSYSLCDVLMQIQGADGTWSRVGSDICSMDYTRNGEELSTITFTLSENKKVTNPFTHQTVGAPRHIKVSINAFLGDLEGTKTIFEFYINQAIDE